MSAINITPMGNAFFVAWASFDDAVDAWAKAYFGDHVKGYGERDDTDCNIAVRYLRGSDFVKFSKLFQTYDEDHEHDADEEFCTGDTIVSLPDCFTLGILAEIFADTKLPIASPTFGSVLATYDGVYVMEKSK